ncbi:hypothetical protein SSX86_023350 [Deinandra increscens subsp. villosa]|uniref:Protein kinase domain-containing protein n=1 Tax=Deinandra increscens subsp. villosa TaxID=3103831 RepID=A0AAP0CSC7_9ASTR
MCPLKLFIFALISVSSLNYCNAIHDEEEEDDVLGLTAFKADIIDTSSHLSSWNQDDTSPCSWNFITCNPATGRVTELSLTGLNLSGKIGRGLEKVQSLQVLNLAHNSFTGSLNPHLLLLNNLESLNLSHNGLSGGIPPFLTNCRRLKFLDLSKNSLSGRVPGEFFLTCSSLRVLSLSGNNLNGPIPNSISQCTSLNHVNLSKNRFSGNPDFATGLWKLTRVRTMDLSHNGLTGRVANGVSNLPYLKELLLQGNHFSGGLPSDLGLCSHLKKLDVSGNQLTGEFPKWVGRLTGLEYLDLSGNGLTGTLPDTIGGSGSLTYISLSGNDITGSIPSSLIHSGKLSVVRLRGNMFNGSIPEGLFELGLKQIDLSRNQLTGSVPPGSSRLFETLESMDLSANGLSGDIPAEMGLFSRLRYLNLSWNSFDTRMPLKLGYFQNLTVLDLRNGAFHGPVPVDICNSASLEILQVDGNSLTGTIPEEIGKCSSLYLLSMSHNDLTGFIPRSMSLLKRLKILKLDANNLIGEIPQSLGELDNLLSVNISYNRLQGRLPDRGIFPGLQESCLEGNLGLCSPFLKGPCKMDVPKPLVLDPFAYPNQNGNHQGETSRSKGSNHHKFLSVSVIIAILAAVLISIAVLVISLLNISARKRIQFVGNAIESCSSSSRSTRSLSIGKLVWFDSKIAPAWVANPETLLHKAAEIGKGVFGNVYKASLGEEGRDLAIKNLVVSNMVQYPEDFDREVRVLAKARHPNLVSVKGYYWTPNLQLLVTDYAPNGSLQCKLHEKSTSSQPLSWARRFKILLGTAKGLAHLHHSFRPPIVHYNLKPSNILLDHDFNPKISDFGLTRIVAKLDKQVMSNRFQSALGYVAPELACQSLRVNEKCDVYGFGILVLEMVTGRRPVEYGDDNVMILEEQVKVMLEDGNVLECVDESMGEYPEDEVLPVLKLALVCTSQIPSSRPSMAEVIQILHVINTPVPHRREAY